MWGQQSTASATTNSRPPAATGSAYDWPIGHADLAPYYERVERFVGISGGTENLPQPCDSVFLPPMSMTCGERLLKNAVEASGKTAA